MEMVIAILGYIAICIIALNFLISKNHTVILVLDWVIVILTLPVILSLILIVALISPHTLKSIWDTDSNKDR